MSTCVRRRVNGADGGEREGSVHETDATDAVDEEGAEDDEAEPASRTSVSLTVYPMKDNSTHELMPLTPLRMRLRLRERPTDLVKISVESAGCERSVLGRVYG